MNQALEEENKYLYQSICLSVVLVLWDLHMGLSSAPRIRIVAIQEKALMKKAHGLTILLLLQKVNTTSEPWTSRSNLKTTELGEGHAVGSPPCRLWHLLYRPLLPDSRGGFHGKCKTIFPASLVPGVSELGRRLCRGSIRWIFVFTKKDYVIKKHSFESLSPILSKTDLLKGVLLF